MLPTAIHNRPGNKPEQNRGPRFGCRNLMVVSNQRMGLKALFGPLVGWDNSFVEQSMERPPEWVKNKSRYCGLETQTVYPANPHGIGLLTGKPASPLTKRFTTPTLVKSPQSFTHPKALLKALGYLGWSRPSIMMAHIREKSDPRPTHKTNTHPFELTLKFPSAPFTPALSLRMHMLHNGAINRGMQTPQIQQALSRLPQEEPLLYPRLPQGTTDTEQLFRLIVVKLREGLGKHPNERLTPEEMTPAVLQKAVAKTILDIEKYCKPFPHPDQKRFPGRMVNPGFNVMLTVDLPVTGRQHHTRRMMIVTRKGPGLYKTWLETPGKNGQDRKTLIVASEMMHPRGKTLNWQPFKEDETLTMIQDAKTGQTQGWQSTLQALSEGVPHRYDWVI